MEDPNEIRDFINTNLRQEWEADLKDQGRSLGSDQWLQTLPKRRWRLEVVETDEIILDPNIMNSSDPRRGYSFQDSLSKRRKELQTVIETFGVVIWPVVVRHEDMTLVDGYCRLTAVREIGVSQVYVYLGSM